jgi:pimeloyl-ACP methyl ester carboxylesterase
VTMRGPRRAACKIDGTVVGVTRWGAGAPVLCLHALGHAAEDFEAFAERVGHRCEVIALDWPGHGTSPDDGGEVCAERFAELALGARRVLGLERPVVLGNSLGGAAALVAASRAPSTFAGLVLCNSAGLAPVDLAARAAVAVMTRFFAAGARGAGWFRPAFAAYYRHVVLTAPAAAARRDAIVAQAERLAPLLRAGWRGFGEPLADLRHLAPRVACPVWIAWARGDRVVALRRALPAIARFSNVTTTRFEGSHAAFLEDPGAFAEGFLAFAAPMLSREAARPRA